MTYEKGKEQGVCQKQLKKFWVCKGLTDGVTCGYYIYEEYNYCPKCGTSVEIVEATPKEEKPELYQGAPGVVWKVGTGGVKRKTV